MTPPPPSAPPVPSALSPSSSSSQPIPRPTSPPSDQQLPHPPHPQPEPQPQQPSSLSPSQPNAHSPHHRQQPSLTRLRIAKKIQKRRKESRHHLSMDLPERLKDHGEDAEADVIQPAQGPQMFMNMNQSIFGIIAAARSTVDFNDRFEGQSSEDEDAADDSKGKEREDVARTTVLAKGPVAEKDKTGRHRRRISGQLLRSLPQLPRLGTRSLSKRSSKRKGPAEPESSADGDADADAEASSSHTNEPQSPTIGVTKADRDGRRAPVMSRILEARAEMSSRPSFDLERVSGDYRRGDGDSDDDTRPSALSRRLKEIFEFEEFEEVVEEYPCWLLQSVLLQGYMYITAKHICFYAYLPKKAHEVAKSGYLSKSGKRNPKYNRYWFRLKGDILAYYRDASNLYFPNGQIDLRYAISASISDKDKDGLHFTVATPQRTYHFRADSAPSAKEWVKSLQRVIFRSHNDGDSVKISLPIENVLDIEDSQMIEFADTCKIRVIDNDETYAIDEYFFSFFSFGKEAINVLKILIEDASKEQSKQQSSGAKETIATSRDHRTAEPRNSSISVRRDGSPPSDGAELKSPKLREYVRATLSPTQPMSPRASIDSPRTSRDMRSHSGRKSVDRDTLGPSSQHRSFSGSRSLGGNRRGAQPVSSEKHGSSESFAHSSEDPSGMSALMESSNEDPSGSQILRGSEVFHSPTIRRAVSDASPTRQGKSGDRKRSHRPNDIFPVSHAQYGATTGHVNDGHAQPDTPTLQNIVKMGAYPLQRAGLFANYLNQTSRRMSNLLATESMGYVEKVSGMWKGGRKHYHDQAGLKTDDELYEEDEDGQIAGATDRFRAHFALPGAEKLQATYFGFLSRVLPLYGKIYISDRHFCYRSLLPGTRTKLILPLKEIENVHKEKGFRFGYSGLVVVIRGHEELFFEFSQADVRDDCTIMLLQCLEAARYLRESAILDKSEQELADEAIAERDALQEARLQLNSEHDVQLPQQTSSMSDSAPTILFDDPKASFLNFKPAQPMKVTCLTIGSRGDVQPYIALCKGLMAEGHTARIATHAEFKGWIEGHGIEFAPVEGDPAELMRICIQNGTFTWAFLREANSKFRGWLDELLVSAWEACQGSDLLVESPSAMAGIHIAEALGIPYFRAFTMPWTRTRAYPHAFVMPEHKMGGAYNYFTYLVFDSVFWKATAGQVNRWRNTTLGLPNTSLEKLQPNKVPFLYNFSPSVVAPPLDYSDWIRVTGYWFLDEGKDYVPPDDLREFIEAARRDKKKLVYVGFGSIIVPDPAKMTQEVINAVLRADVRCVLSKGWSDRLEGPGRDVPEVQLPPEIFQIKSAPHDWLFAQMDAAAHHGGSGTTGASLRAGIPTIIRPFFGDQFFFGARLEDLGVGICLRKWGAGPFGRALWEATHSERMIVKARVLGESIRKESGVDTAIQSIYRDLEYAKSLIKSKAGKNAAAAQARASGAAAQGAGGAADTAASLSATSEYDASLDIDADDEEESWTFVGAGGGSGSSETESSSFASQAGVNTAAVGGTGLPGGAGAGSTRLSLRSRLLGGVGGGTSSSKSTVAAGS